MIHSVKCSSNYFLDLLSGRKTFELRFNDRDYKVGDYLAVNETKHFAHSDDEISSTSDNTVKTLPDSPESEMAYSGRCLLYKITYVLKDAKFLVPGMVALGLKRMELPFEDQNIDNSNFRSISKYANGMNHT